MTSTKAGGELLKQDARGRVRVSAQRREALLDEFERSGASGAKFARLAGIKYATFANWVQQRRRRRAGAGVGSGVPGAAGGAVAKAGPLRLVEAVLEDGGHASADRAQAAAAGPGGLVIDLAGGSRMRIESPAQLEMAAELLALMAQRARVRC